MPEPSTRSSHRALATIVFTDVVGCSTHMGQNEERALTAIQRDLGLMRRLCEQYEGWVVKEIGDALMVHFGSAVKAVECAQAMQRAIANQARQLPPGSLILQHRIGMHLGDVVIDDHDVRGDGVNIAARIQTAAQPGTVYFSQTVRDAIPAQYYEAAVKIGSRSLKNIDTPVMLYAFPALRVEHKHTYRGWTIVAGSAGAAVIAIAMNGRPPEPVTTPQASAENPSPSPTPDPSTDELAISIASTVDEPELPASSTESATADTTAAAATNDYAAFTLSPGFEWTRGTGNTGGPRLASEAMGIAITDTGKCSGYINTVPDHRLTLTADFDYLNIGAITEGYSSLVILGPNAEVWCATQQNPGIEGFYERGTYDICISHLRQGTGPRYELLITELP